MKEHKPRRGAAIACLVGCGLGLLVLLAGVGWSLFGDARMLYSKAQAEEWVEAHAAWHAASIGHSHGSSGETGAADNHEGTLAAARERFERADAALNTARFAKDRLGKLLVWVGLALAGAFGVGYLVARAAA